MKPIYIVSFLKNEKDSNRVLSYAFLFKHYKTASDFKDFINKKDNGHLSQHKILETFEEALKTYEEIDKCSHFYFSLA